MARNLSEETKRLHAAIRERAAWVLANLYAGGQRRLAAAMRVDPSKLSRVLTGKLGSSPAFIDALASLPQLNSAWVREGVGEPLSPPTRGTLPIAFAIPPGKPESYPDLFTGERYPVAEAFDRPSRYWWRIPAGCRLLDVKPLALLAGDLILFDANVEVWTGQLDLHVGRLFGVRMPRTAGAQCEWGLLTRDDKGLMLDLFGRIARLKLLAPPLSECEAKEMLRPPRGRSKRVIHPHIVDKLTGKPAGEAASSERPRSTSLVCEVADLIAMRVFTARP